MATFPRGFLNLELEWEGTGSVLLPVVSGALDWGPWPCGFAGGLAVGAGAGVDGGPAGVILTGPIKIRPGALGLGRPSLFLS